MEIKFLKKCNQFQFEELINSLIIYFNICSSLFFHQFNFLKILKLLNNNLIFFPNSGNESKLSTNNSRAKSESTYV